MDHTITNLRQIFRILGKGFWKHYEEAVRSQTLTRPAEGDTAITLSKEQEAFRTVLKPNTVVILYHPREKYVATKYQAFMGTQPLEWKQYRRLGSEVTIRRTENSIRIARRLVATLGDIAVVCEIIRPEFVGSTGTSHVYVCNPEHPETTTTATMHMMHYRNLESQLRQEYRHDRSVAPQRAAQEEQIANLTITPKDS